VLVVLACGIALFLWRLGSAGLVDETPPLFAASARAMAETGDRLTPGSMACPATTSHRWSIGDGGGLPAAGPTSWNPLGSWAASLPSALASVGDAGPGSHPAALAPAWASGRRRRLQ
jgi:hypothetical protein